MKSLLLVLVLVVWLVDSTRSRPAANSTAANSNRSNRTYYVYGESLNATERWWEHSAVAAPPEEWARKVVLLKTHKTGSTTVSSLVKAHALRRGLIPVLPGSSDYAAVAWPACSPRLSLTVKNYEDADAFDVLFTHARWCPLVRSLIPGARTFTIMREPVARTVSAINFFSPRVTVASYLAANQSYGMQLLVKAMSFDLDYNGRLSKEQFFHNLAGDFGLVMIYEQLDQSVVLLSRYLRWPISQMYVLPMLVGQTNYRFTVADLSAEQIDGIRAANAVDVHIYDRFLHSFATLWQTARQFGADDDLALYRRVESFCLSQRKPPTVNDGSSNNTRSNSTEAAYDYAAEQDPFPLDNNVTEVYCQSVKGEPPHRPKRWRIENHQLNRTLLFTGHHRSRNNIV